MKFNFTTTFPTSLDSFTNPTSGNSLNSPDHAGQHANINDSVAALEAKVGINSSAVTTSHDYKLSGVTGTDKAVSKTGSETLTNKTLTSPVINVGGDATGDLYYRNSGGAFTRLPIGSASQILSVSSGIPAWVANPSAANSSSTIAGIVELATAAEITAGTATGGTGAALVITPDQLALSSPTFSAANLTNVKPTISLSGTASASISGSTINTTQNIDTSVTMSATAKIITVNFWLKGFSGAGSATYSMGTAIFDGTTCKSYFSPLYNSTSTTISATTFAVGSSSPIAGGDASNGGWTMSIQSLTSTGFTFRLTYTQGSTFNGGDYKATVSATV